MRFSAQKKGRDLGGDDSSVAVVVVKGVGSEVGKTQVQIPASLSSSSETLNELLHLSKPPFPQLSKGNETVTTS